MRSSKYYVLPILVFVLGGLLIAFLATGKDAPEAKPIQASSPLPVDLIQISPGASQATVHTQGTVQARTEIDLVVEVAGKIEFVSPQFVAGGFFDEGDVLLRVNSSDYEIAKIQADARVAEAEELLATTEGRALQAKREWRELGTKTANALFLRKPQLARAKAQVAAAKAQARKAQLDVQRTSLRLPFAGRIRATRVDLGQYINPGANLGRAYSIDSAEVRLPLSDRQVALLDLPLAASSSSALQIPLTLRGTFGGKEWRWPATIVRTEGAIDPQSRVVYVVAEVKKPYSSDPTGQRPPLTVGQFVEADINGKALSAVTELPRNALRANNTVWLLSENNTLSVVSVDIVQLTATKAIVAGLAAGNHSLITSSIPLPIKGMPLSPPDSVPELVLNGEQSP